MKNQKKIFSNLCLSLLILSIVMIGVSKAGVTNGSIVNASERPHIRVEALPKANFTDSYSSYPYDDDSDGIYEELHLVVEFSVNELGRYKVVGWLLNPITGQDHHFYSDPATFTSLGIYNFLCILPGSWIWSQHTTTSYTINYIYLEEVDNNDDYIEEWDYAYNPYTTSTYNSDDFIPPLAYFTGYFSTSLLDTDDPKDGLADFLAVDIEVQADSNIDLELQVELDLETGNHWNYEYAPELTPGTHIIQVTFPSQIFYSTLETRNYTFNFFLYDLDEWEQIDCFYDFQSTYYNYLEFTPPGASLTKNISDYGIDTNADGTFNYVQLDIEIDVVKKGIYRVNGYIRSDNGWQDDYIEMDFSLLDVGVQAVSFKVDRHFFYSQTSGSQVYISELYLSEYLEDYGDLELEYSFDRINFSHQYSYDDFDPQNARIIEMSGDYGVDFDSDGFFDVLRVVFSVEVTVDWIDLDLVAELETNSTGELYMDKSFRYFGLSLGNNEIFLDFPCDQLNYSGFNDTLVIRHYHLYQIGGDYQSLDIEHREWILSSHYSYEQFSTLTPNLIEITSIWPNSGAVYSTNAWIGVGVEFRKFGFADATSVNVMAYLDDTPHSLTFLNSEDWGEEEVWHYDLHIDEDGIWTIEVEIMNTNGPSTSGRTILVVCNPPVLNKLSFSYPSVMVGGTIEVFADVWDAAGIDKVKMWVDTNTRSVQILMDKIGPSDMGELFSGSYTFEESGEFWIYIEVINAFGLSSDIGGDRILVLEAPEILDVDVSPRRYVELGIPFTVEVEILRADIPISDVSMTLIDEEMNSTNYTLTLSDDTEKSVIYSSIEITLQKVGDYDCTVEVTNAKDQVSTYTMTIVIEAEDITKTISPAFEYLILVGSLIVVLLTRKRFK